MLVKPNFLGVGEHKCGTTWLSECLRYHAEIFLSSPKELFFFGKQYFEKDIKWYLEHFEAGRGYKAIGEFSTSYLQKKEAPKQIIESLGKIKILVCIRNPIDRFVSNYKHLVRTGKLPKKDYIELNKETFGKAIRVEPKLLIKGKYTIGIESYFNFFGREKVHIVLNEEMRNEGRKTVAAVYRFLGVDGRFQPPILNRVISQGIMPKYVQIEKSRIFIWRLMKNYWPTGIDFLKKHHVGDYLRKLNTDEFLVTDEVITELRSYYSPEIERLQRLTEMDLKLWNM